MGKIKETGMTARLDGLKTAAEIVHRALFDTTQTLTVASASKEILNFNKKVFAQGSVLAFDIGDYRFITQNPNKKSEYGEMAATGKQISWAIHLPTNIWVLRTIDGKVEALLREESIPTTTFKARHQ